MDEYNSLRSEIISIQEKRRNVWIHMYILFISIFVLAIEFSYKLFLVSYIVLIPFQIVICRYDWGVKKISSYIRIFYEECDNNLTWESFHVFKNYREIIDRYNKSIMGLTRYTGSSQLGFLASVFFIINFLSDKFYENIFHLKGIDVIYLLASVFLFIVTVYINQTYNKNHIEDLESVIREYKSICEKERSKK